MPCEALAWQGQGPRHAESVAVPTRHYVGFTEDLRRRMTAHNEGKLPTTLPHRPWQRKTSVFLEKAGTAFREIFKARLWTRLREKTPVVVCRTELLRSDKSYDCGAALENRCP